jgi:hypothetical protein
MFGPPRIDVSQLDEHELAPLTPTSLRNRRQSHLDVAYRSPDDHDNPPAQRSKRLDEYPSSTRILSIMRFTCGYKPYPSSRPLRLLQQVLRFITFRSGLVTFSFMFLGPWKPTDGPYLWNEIVLGVLVSVLHAMYLPAQDTAYSRCSVPEAERRLAAMEDVADTTIQRCVKAKLMDHVDLGAMPNFMIQQLAPQLFVTPVVGVVVALRAAFVHGQGVAMWGGIVLVSLSFATIAATDA